LTAYSFTEGVFRMLNMRYICLSRTAWRSGC